MSQRRRLIGVVGGTFDPVHFGHLRMALEAGKILRLDEVRFIPAARPPHRAKPVATAQQRLKMVALAIAAETRFVVDDREWRREGDSYMVDTLESLGAELGENGSLVLMMGSDAFPRLTRWHQWHRLLQLAHIGVVLRPGNVLDLSEGDLELQRLYASHRSTDLGDLTKKSCGVICTLETTALGISASAIRKGVAAGESAKFLLPETVLNYIDEHNLYR